MENSRATPTAQGVPGLRPRPGGGMTEQMLFMVYACSSPSDVWSVAAFTTEEQAEAACELYREELSKQDHVTYGVEELTLDPPLEPSPRLLRWRQQRGQR